MLVAKSDSAWKRKEIKEDDRLLYICYLNKGGNKGFRCTGKMEKYRAFFTYVMEKEKYYKKTETHETGYSYLFFYGSVGK